MADMVGYDYDLILVLPRFGIPLGFGERTVRDVCRDCGVNEEFFLMVCNMYSFDDYRPEDEMVARTDKRMVAEYLIASHRYYVEERLPHLQKRLEVVADSMGVNSAMVLKRFFGDYCREVKEHVEREERNLSTLMEDAADGEGRRRAVSENFVKNHEGIKDKLSDLRQIVLKYVPGERMGEEVMEVVFDMMQLSRDLEKHAELEELLLMPEEDCALSEREREVLELVARGCSSKEVAERLSISVNTVNTHRKSITRKTGIRSVAGLAVYWRLYLDRSGKRQ